MENMNKVKQTEAFKELESSGLMKSAAEIKDKVMKELKQN